MWKVRFGLYSVEETHLFVPVLVLGLSAAARPPGGSDIPGDDRDLMQWHVHPSRPMEFSQTQKPAQQQHDGENH